MLGRIEVKSTKKVSDDQLARLRQEAWKERLLPSMHWFIEADKWRRLSFAYNNPYNIISVHSELFLLRELSVKLDPLVSQQALVFLGVGVGDTEMFFVERELQVHGRVDVVAVDVNQEFLDDFERSLRNKCIESDSYGIRLRCPHSMYRLQ